MAECLSCWLRFERLLTRAQNLIFFPFINISCKLLIMCFTAPNVNLRQCATQASQCCSVMTMLAVDAHLSQTLCMRGSYAGSLTKRVTYSYYT